MPKTKEERIYLKRFKKHQTDLNKLMQSVSVNDNRKVLVKFVSLMLDGDPETLRPFMESLIRAQFIDGRGIKWRENDGTKEERPSLEDLDAGDKVAGMLAEFLKVKE